MMFTREPIVETIIAPREGWKLLVKSSKVEGAEGYCVDAVEVVSFGTALFFRSLEGGKAFLLPVSDYEVVETREARTLLKHVPERSAKARLTPEAPEGEVGRGEEERGEKRRGRRHRGGKQRHAREEGSREASVEMGVIVVEEETQPPQREEEAWPADQEVKAFLIPPPSLLISDTLARYKEAPETRYVQEEEADPSALSEEEFL